MVKERIAIYIWLIDTLLLYGKLTREEIDKIWRKSELSDGEGLPRRTFYHYRRNIEKIFNIDIKCDSIGRYFIESNGQPDRRSATNLMLESFAVGSAFRDNPIPEGRIEVEDVPSARQYLPYMLDAISRSVKIVISYSSFSRSRTEHNILFQPYFMKRYRQRWYVIGLKEKDMKIRTYALDRISEFKLTEDKFEMSPTITADEIFGSIIGVTTSQAPVKTVKLMVTPQQAKYFRALPLHHSQTEEINDDYSIFTYRLKLNYELAHEILGFGDTVKVIEPPELRAMVVTQLKDTLALYEKK